MTHEEIRKMLIDHFKEEVEDAIKYHHAAEAAEEADDDWLAFYLESIARDEKSHAQFIKNYAERHEMVLPPCENWHKLKYID